MFSYMIICPQLDHHHTIQFPTAIYQKSKTAFRQNLYKANIALDIQHTCSCLFIEHVERGTVWLLKGLFLQLLLLNHKQDRTNDTPASPDVTKI